MPFGATGRQSAELSPKRLARAGVQRQPVREMLGAHPGRQQGIHHLIEQFSLFRLSWLIDLAVAAIAKNASLSIACPLVIVDNCQPLMADQSVG